MLIQNLHTEMLHHVHLSTQYLAQTVRHFPFCSSLSVVKIFLSKYNAKYGVTLTNRSLFSLKQRTCFKLRKKWHLR
jgi:hypothetical protein